MRNLPSTLLYRWFEEVWNKGDENAIDQLMTSDASAHGITAEEEVHGAEGFKAFFRGFRTQFHHIHINIDDVIAQDDVECARTTVAATHSASNKNVRFAGLCMVRVAGGKIAEAWNHYDFLGMHQQLGQALTPVKSPSGG